MGSFCISLSLSLSLYVPMVTGFMNYDQQTIRAARYIDQGFMIILFHVNCLPVII
jgi:hypothetical protein